MVSSQYIPVVSIKPPVNLSVQPSLKNKNKTQRSSYWCLYFYLFRLIKSLSFWVTPLRWDSLCLKEPYKNFQNMRELKYRLFSENLQTRITRNTYLEVKQRCSWKLYFKLLAESHDNKTCWTFGFSSLILSKVATWYHFRLRTEGRI